MERRNRDFAKLAFVNEGVRIDGDQRARFERYLAEILEALGLTLGDDGTRHTPGRLLQAWIDATAGYERDPKLVTLFPLDDASDADAYAGQIVEGPIPFTALCEHHVLPFFGRAWIGYLPADRLIGLSKLTRIVRQYARRFTMQERLGGEVSAVLQSIAGARGAGTHIEAVHLCTRMRGVCESEAVTRTTAWRGDYRTNEALRREFFALCVDR